jgi:RND family efflux transporter MFP subunit
MDLVPQSSLAGVAEPATAGGTHAPVALSERGRALAGVVTEVARRERLSRSIRAVGSVVADERRQTRAQSKVTGWVEKLNVAATGQYVKQGDVALAVYSPALLAAQSEYLLARDTATRFAGSELPEVRRGGQDLFIAARRKLELLDVSADFLADLDRTRQPSRTVDLLVPASGFVTSKAVVLGQEIAPGIELYTVTDLSRVWVEAAFFEAEARYVAVGSKATLSFPFAAGAQRPAEVAYVYPTLDAAARTLTARFELANPKLELRPGMFVDVALEVDLGEAVTVPDSAVLDSGLRRIVFVEGPAGADGAPGALGPREVETGERSGGRIAIVRGVAAGEKVATRANFLLDAESRLISSAAGGTGGGREDGVAAPPSSPTDPHAGHR